MYEKYMICTQDFRNTVSNGTVTGFQVKVRIPYYRGIMVSLIEKLSLKIDDETITRDNIRFAIGDRMLTMNEVEQASDVRWPFNKPATLLVNRPGGLSIGTHKVQFDITIRKSYIPKTDPDKLFTFAPINGQPYLSDESATKKITLVI